MKRKIEDTLQEWKIVRLLPERERKLGGGSLPLASARCAVFRYPLCGAPPRNAPKDSDY
jgi:hypothetical protein